MKQPKLKGIYLDVCALERPYDDQRYMRIRIEATAIELITACVKADLYTLYYSPVHEEEISQNTNEIRRTEIELLLHNIAKNVKPLVKDNNHLENRGWKLSAKGFGIADAFHIAYAESVGADFITCDDELLKRSRKYPLKVWCGTPIDFCMKEGLV